MTRAETARKAMRRNRPPKRADRHSNGPHSADRPPGGSSADRSPGKARCHARRPVVRTDHFNRGGRPIPGLTRVRAAGPETPDVQSVRQARAVADEPPGPKAGPQAGRPAKPVCQVRRSSIRQSGSPTDQPPGRQKTRQTGSPAGRKPGRQKARQTGSPTGRKPVRQPIRQDQWVKTLPF